MGEAIGGTDSAIVDAIAAVGTTIAIPGLDLVVAGPTFLAEDWKKTSAADVQT